MKLDELVQLHEGIEIIYVVDGYLATLTTQDGAKQAFEGRAESVIEALISLEKAVEQAGVNLKDLRARGRVRKDLGSEVRRRYGMEIESNKRIETRISEAGDRRDADSLEFLFDERAASKVRLDLLKQLMECDLS